VSIKLFAMDVDGVLTDAGMYYSENGDELKKFNTRDGKGIELLRNADIKTAIITSENTEIVKRRAQKLKIDFVYQGVQNKLETVEQLCNQLQVSLCDVAYIGDDINDVPLLKKVGFSACPKNAMRQNKDIAKYICLLNGGEGCVREFIEEVILSSISRLNQ
jgi:YrbI family 3-deoxy-D-manno-octulosonate 8-phosphate phosphatase